jgi:hypothetical protein
MPCRAFGLTGPSVLDAVPLPPVEVVVMDLDPLNAGLAADGEPPIDGILGAPVLVDTSAVIDYGEPALYLAAGPIEAELDLALQDALEARGFDAVPLRRDPVVAFLWLDAEVDEVGPLVGLLDTGAQVTALELAAATALELELAPAGGSASTGGGPIGTFVTSVEALGLGGIALGARTVPVLDLGGINASLATVGLDPIEVLVGGDVLVERRAVVSAVGDVLFLLPSI